MNTLDELGLTLPQFFILIACTAAVCAIWEFINREPPAPPPAVVASPAIIEAVASIHPGWTAARVAAEAALVESPPIEAQPSARERYDRAIAAYVTACDEWNAAAIELRNTTHYTNPPRTPKTQQQA